MSCPHIELSAAGAKEMQAIPGNSVIIIGVRGYDRFAHCLKRLGLLHFTLQSPAQESASASIRRRFVPLGLSSLSWLNVHQKNRCVVRTYDKMRRDTALPMASS
jgi:hypothetical protein